MSRSFLRGGGKVPRALAEKKGKTQRRGESDRVGRGKNFILQYKRNVVSQKEEILNGGKVIRA